MEVFLFGSIINRLILLELIKVFLLSLTALTGLFLLGGLIQEATQRGLSPGQILMVIPLLIPNTLPYTIPATTLFATCVVYGRMAHDNEILVLKTAGVNILHLLKPALALGILTTLVTMYLYYDTIPRTQRIMRQKVLSDAEEVLYGLIKREGCLRQPGMQYVMYVREVQGKRLIDVVFKRRQPNGQGYDVVARTREARLRFDTNNNKVLIDMGRCVVFGEKDGVGAVVDDQVYPVPLPDSLFGKDYKMRTASLTWEELQEREREVNGEVRDAEQRYETVLLNQPGAAATAHQREVYQKSLSDARYQIEHFQRAKRGIEAEMQMRPAIAIGCLCFVLIGCPVGIWASRSDYLSTFVICFLPAVFIYYPLLLCGTNLAKEGRLPAHLAIWAADAILGVASLFLIWRLMRR
jgi:lipopolysaccharide export system permease protein